MKIDGVETVVLVASGKGGVGKTTVSADLAKEISAEGREVGLIDADVSTPNTIEMVAGDGTDLSESRLSDGDSLLPPRADGVQVISQGITLPDDVPVLGDGEWRSGVVIDYIENVEWDDDTSVVVIDSPPGSGAEVQVIASSGLVDQAYVVTTPHHASQRDATKTVEMLDQYDVPHSGVVNMAYIPTAEILSHVFRESDFDEIHGVGKATVQSMQEMMEDAVPDYGLFGYERGDDHVLDTDVVATVPYAEGRHSRAWAYDPILMDVLPDWGVEK